MAIAASADTRYAWAAALSLLSAAAHSDMPVVCLLVGDQLDANLANAVRDAFDRSAIPFRYVDAQLDDLDSLPTGFHFTRAAYGRLRVVEASRSLASRTLYLDADTLTIGDISSLADLTFKAGDVIAAVRASGIPTVGSSGGVADWKERRLDPAAPFFNSGVLLIENEEWLRNGINSQVVEQLVAAPSAATFADQGALNAALYGRWTELRSAWNYQVTRSPALRFGPFAISRRYRLNLRRTRILHFFQSIKPWDPRYPPGALTDLYREAWDRLLPVAVPAGRTFREWIRERY
jgi:lipopolysaccharide biosynthesis glycosyltransferase